MKQPTETHVTVELDGDFAADLLHVATGLPKQRIKHAMRSGAVWHTRDDHSQRLRRAKRALQAGDQIHLYYDERVLNEVPPEPTLVADKGEYSVWHKPRGMRSQGSKWGDHCTIQRWAQTHLQPERTSYTVHRLDLATNGLILVAHSKTMAAKFGELFRQRRIEKRYRAIAHGDLSKLPEATRFDSPIDDKAAVSEITFLQQDAGQQSSLLDINLLTGRKHQIRRHLAEAGHPIVGDVLYGSTDSDSELQLTARLLSFHCPVDDKTVVYELDDALLPQLPVTGS